MDKGEVYPTNLPGPDIYANGADRRNKRVQSNVQQV